MGGGKWGEQRCGEFVSDEEERKRRRSKYSCSPPVLAQDANTKGEGLGDNIRLCQADRQ